MRSLLEGPSAAVLSTYRKDGTALVSPVWFRWTGEAFEVVIAEGDVKLRHLARDPRCVLVVFETVPPFRGVEARGAAELVEVDVTPVREAIASRYLGVEAGRRFAGERRSKPGVLLRLDAGEPRVWDRSWILPAESEESADGIAYRWRGPLTDEEMVELVRSHGGNAVEGWWDRIRRHSLGWVVARAVDGTVVGFVNVAWDGGDHAFLLDPKTHGEFQHGGIGTRLVELAVRHAKDAGCEWLHVDFDPELEPFYLDACGFRPTPAGLIHLTSLP